MCKSMQYDDYEIITKDLAFMLDEIKKMHEETRWEIFPNIHELKAYAFVPTEIDVPDQDRPDLHSLLQTVDRNLAFDTADEGTGTRLIVGLGKQGYLLRQCALPSILQVAGINGTTIGKLRREKVADWFNDCFDVLSGPVKAIIRAGKCSAIRSNNYIIMDSKDVFDIAMKKIEKKMGTMDFIEGYNSHEYTSMVFELPDAQDKFLKLYHNALTGSAGGYRGVNFMPAVRISTSDIGNSAATITPLYKYGTSYLRFVSPIKVEHRSRGSMRACGLEAFAESADGVFAKFNDTIETIAKMADTTIYHPINAIRALCRRVLLPEYVIAEAVKSHELLGTGQCSMHDVYLSIYDGFASVESPTTRLDLEEKAQKILSLNWKEFDLYFLD